MQQLSVKIVTFQQLTAHRALTAICSIIHASQTAPMDIFRTILSWPVWLVLLAAPNAYLQATVVCSAIITISCLTTLVLVRVQPNTMVIVHLWYACHVSNPAIAVSTLVTA